MHSLRPLALALCRPPPRAPRPRTLAALAPTTRPSPALRTSTSTRSLHASPARTDAQSHSQPPQVPLNAPHATRIAQVDRRLRITFTCTASLATDLEPDRRQCGHRSSHEFSKRSYDRGVVIVQCPGCSNRHLIADHLHWFSTTPSPSHPTGQPFGAERARTVEDLLREKGERVTWGTPGDADAAEQRGQLKWVVQERDEQDGGKTVEVLPAAEVPAPTETQMQGEEGERRSKEQAADEADEDEIRTLPVQ
ncbi:hypothetical protein JCM3770_003903 [Rhodotorula araucariae]